MVLNSTFLVLIQILLISLKKFDSAPLPQWMFRVKSCPDPNDINQWKEASKRLNCFHDLTSKDPLEQGAVYHCLPSTYFNESVEFCGRSVPVSPGNCPVYNYKYAQNKLPSYYNCGNFSAGCPQMMFHSKEVYKYPMCLKLNSGCYEADKNCVNKSSNITVTTVPNTRTKYVDGSPKTTSEPSIKKDQNTENEMSPEFEMNPVKSYDNDGKYLPIWIFLGVVVVILPVFAVVWKRKHLPCLGQKTTEVRTISEEEVELMRNQNPLVKMPAETFEMEDIAQGNCATENTIPKRCYDDVSHTEEGESIPGLDEHSRGVTNWRYNDFLKGLEEHMSEELLNRIKCRLKDRPENRSSQRESEDTTDGVECITTASDLLDYLSKTYLSYHNIVFLQGIFLASNAPKLYDRCLQYAESREDEIIYFEKRVLVKDHKKVVYKICCPNVKKYKRSELEKLIKLISSLIQANYDDIIVSGVTNGCVLVTLMIRKCLIPSLRSLYAPSKRNMTYQWMMSLPLQYKIVQVTIEDDVVYMPDQLLSVEGLTKEAKLSGSSQNLSYPLDHKEKNPVCISTGDENVETTSKCALENCVEDSDEILRCKKNKKQILELNKFLEELSGCITDDILQSMKFLLYDFIEEKIVKEMNTCRILDHLLSNFQLQYNMPFLQWMFDKCGENCLSEKCSQFESKNRFELLCFHSEGTPCKGRQHLKIHIMVLELEAYQAEVHDLRNWLAKTINIHPGEILMTALENGPIVVTFMMREKHAKAFSKFLQTDDGQIAASRKRVDKIFQNGKWIKIGRALNGSNFVHVRLRFQDSVPRQILQRGKQMVTSAISHILRDTNLQMQGREVYLQATDLSKIDNKEEEISAKKNILKHWDSLVAELEPLTALNELKSCFNEGHVEKINNVNCREERAEMFLNICCKLPQDKVEKVWTYLEEHCSTAKEDDVDLASTREWIKSNWDDIIDEIDNDFFDTTIQNIKDVPYEVHHSWTDVNKGRAEKAKLFLQFVLTRHDSLKALQKTLHEYGMDCP